MGLKLVEGPKKIDWDSEAMRMVLETIKLEDFGYSPQDAKGMAEALCAKRLGWY